jgi:hypothetical protein
VAEKKIKNEYASLMCKRECFIRAVERGGSPGEDDHDHTARTRSGFGIREGRNPSLCPQTGVGIGTWCLDTLPDLDRCLSNRTRSRLCRCLDRQLLNWPRPRRIHFSQRRPHGYRDADDHRRLRTWPHEEAGTSVPELGLHLAGLSTMCLRHPSGHVRGGTTIGTFTP